MRGNWFLSHWSRDDNAEAIRLFEKALEIDSRSAAALNGLAFALLLANAFSWTLSHDETRTAALAAGQRAIALNPKDAEAHVALSNGFFANYQLDSAAAACRSALDLNPNLALAEGRLAHILGWRGDYEEAILHAEKAARLSPHDPIYSWWGIARINIAFGSGDYEEAVSWAKKTIAVRPGSPAGWRYLAASLAHLGRLEEAREARDQLLRVMPHDNLRLVRAYLPSANTDRMKRYVEGLRIAGLPE
jgi:tetratricopeptide (TPR) repeat protein